ncbi:MULTISPECIES: MarR family winged helix-turn-helix transcriptional regulator [Phenylobacterium]|jgi:DNA-binding MarR family transcriptional regulator|uniref:MarR family winged helix-turn-helix transcriptional regulator n=1 Tax=Phenylobacterium conjunctum TaxID=1298959 RepID=A0ABW3T772_9CAUL
MTRKTESQPAIDTSAIPKDVARQMLRLDNQLCFALYAATGLVTRAYRPLLEPLGLTYPQYLAMLVLWEQAPRTVSELGEALGLDSGTLTPLLKRLEQAGYVTRTRDPADERRVQVGLTEAGDTLRERALQVPAAMSCALPMPASELGELKATLQEFARRMRADGAA